MRKNTSVYSGTIFLVAVVTAIIFAVATSISSTIMWILFGIGVFYGLLNIVNPEIHPFLVSSIIVVIASYLVIGAADMGAYATRIFNAHLLVFAPMTIIAAIIHSYSLWEK